MRLLVTEFICGGGLANHALPATLKQEGFMMLQALIADCLSVDNLQIVTTLDARVQLETPNIEIVPIPDSKDYLHQMQAIAGDVDLAWVVAPESEGILASIILELEKENCCTLNSSADAIHVTGDKRECNQAMERAGIPVIQSLPYRELNRYMGKVVIKPRCGVGGEGLRVCNNGKEALQYIDGQDKWMIQPYIDGMHRSLSLLCWQGEAKILACNTQQFSGFPEPKLSKCIVNAFPATAALHALAKHIAATFPGLSGYVGVDYIETGNGYAVVEINPRLTASYIGLAKTLRQNAAQLCLDTIAGGALPTCIENTAYSTEVVLV